MLFRIEKMPHVFARPANQREIFKYFLYYILVIIAGINFSGCCEISSFMVLLLQIPVVLNAIGGILVGLVTSYAGGVRKVSFG